MKRALTGSLLASALICGIAQAQIAPDLKRDCLQMQDMDLKLRSCTQWLDTARNLSPVERALGHNDRGVAYRRKGDVDRAIAEYDSALRLNPNSAVTHNNLAYAYQRKGQLDRALAEYDIAVRLDAKYLPAVWNRGDLHKLRRDWVRAVADYSVAIQLDATKPQLFFDRGFAYLTSGDNDRAIADFNVAIRQMPNNASLLVNRGVALHRKRDLTRAIADFREAARLSPDFELARQNLAAATDELTRTAQLRPVLKPLPAPGAGAIATLAPSNPTASLPFASNETRVALVIGNAAYTGVSPLRNSTNDAQAVAAKLREVGFTKVTLVTDVSREAMIKALATFSRDAETAEWAMVYYAGHGMQISGTNWLIPTDAAMKSDRDAQFQAVSVDQVIAAVDGAKRLRLVVLDACRDNPFAAQMRTATGATRAITRGLGRMEPSSTLVAFAAKDGQTALDGDGRNSPFAEALVRNLGTPGLEMNRLFRRVAAEVLRTTSNQQEPLTYGRLPDEDLFFVAPRPGATPAAAAPAAPARQS